MQQDRPEVQTCQGPWMHRPQNDPPHYLPPVEQHVPVHWHMSLSRKLVVYTFQGIVSLRLAIGFLHTHPPAPMTLRTASNSPITVVGVLFRDVAFGVVRSPARLTDQMP